MEQIINKMKGRLHLEHKAYSTKKSYLHVNTTTLYIHVVNNSFMGVESIGRPGL